MTTTTTIVSGYWSVKGKHTQESFHQWFNYTLRINCPYIFFGNQESIDIVKRIRHDLPTEYVLLDIGDFYTQKYKKHIAEHHIHVPSPEVCLIWLEKMFLMQRAKEMNCFRSDYYMWVDAGICVFRSDPPPSVVFPNVDKMRLLPRDKFIFTSSQEPYESYCVHDNNYYHFISGTAFVMHRDFVTTFTEKYRRYLENIITHYNWVNTEQKILTHMYKDDESLFFKLGEGYGKLVLSLY